LKVLYIGGTGEISYACVQAGAAAGQEIAVFNRGHNHEPLPPNVRRITGSITDDDVYRRLGEERWDAVCQFLAYTTATIERDLEVFAGNVGQYVFISSASAYEKPPRRHVISENTPLVNPYWGYSRAKAEIGERLMRAHGEGRLPVTVVRPSHTYRRRFPSAIINGDHAAWRMGNGKPIVVHGDGTSLWVVTHSDDFAVPFVRLLGNPKALGQAFHITSDDAWTWDQITQAVGAAIGVEPQIVHVPSDTLIRYNENWLGPLLGDKSWSVQFDNRKVKSVAGDFTCSIAMPEGMKRVAEHYRRRADSYTPDEQADALFDRIASEQAVLGR
jgi:nucleoside-diphosphate-sugar epimerase